MDRPAGKLLYSEEMAPTSSGDASSQRVPTTSSFGGPWLDHDGVREDRDGRLLQLQMNEWSRDHPFLAPIPLSKALTADPLTYIRQLDSLDHRADRMETIRAEMRPLEPPAMPTPTPAHVFASRLSMRRMPNRPLQQHFPLLSVSRLPYVPSQDIFTTSTSGNIFLGMPSDLEEHNRSNRVYLKQWVERRFKVLYREQTFANVSSSTVHQSALNQLQARNSAIPAAQPCAVGPGSMLTIQPSQICLRPPDLQNAFPGNSLRRSVSFTASERQPCRRTARRAWSSSSSEDADSEMELSPSSASETENEIPAKVPRKAMNVVESASASSTPSRSSCSSDTSEDMVANKSPRKLLTSMSNDDAPRKAQRKLTMHQLI